MPLQEMTQPNRETDPVIPKTAYPTIRTEVGLPSPLPSLIDLTRLVNHNAEIANHVSLPRILQQTVLTRNTEKNHIRQVRNLMDVRFTGSQNQLKRVDQDFTPEKQQDHEN